MAGSNLGGRLRSTFASIVIAALATGCAARPGPATPGGPPPPGGAARSSNTISIGGYEVNRSLFWLGLAGAAILGGVVLDNVPESASNGELDGMDFVPAGLYTVGGIFLIGAL